MFEVKGKYTTAKVMIENIDPETMRQIHLIVNHPAATNPVVIQPDCHAGKGCVIGFTMKAADKVVPNWTGVDVGCGMLSVRVNLNGLDRYSLALIDKKIREEIPMGMTVNKSYDRNLPARFLALLRQKASETNHAAGKRFSTADASLVSDMVKRVGMDENRFWSSIGTLGGGNHFKEFGCDETGALWITVHTGSRNFGKRVCEHFDAQAQKELRDGGVAECINQLKEKVRKGEISKRDLEKLIEEKRQANKLDFDVKESAYVTHNEWSQRDHLARYLEMMFLAQVYAEMNRKLIIERVIAIISKVLSKEIAADQSIETIHNFISFEDGIIRKGAIQSYIGKWMVIPFNMRDGLLICEGKSNPDWNYSAPHGAGRVLSRRQAKDKITVEDYQKSMEGIFTTSVGHDTLDESPMAYKDSAMIEEAIEPTAKIIHRVKPIYNVKAGGE